MANGNAQAGASGTFSIPNVRRVQTYVIYDEVEITSASGNIRVFADIASKGAHQTNLQKPHELPFREEYDIFAVSIIPRQGVPVADLVLFYDLVAFELGINQKPVFKAPAVMFTAGCGLEGVSGFDGEAGTSTALVPGYYHNGIGSPSAILRFPEPFHVGKGETFYGTLIRDTALSGLSASFYSKVVLHGIIRTLVQ